MKKINVNEIPWVERKSPKGRFHKFRRDIAAAFENPKTGPKLPGQMPFEVELVRLPPQATNFPFHSHSAEWEFYLIVSGTGKVRAGKLTRLVKSGDCILNPPGEAHQIINTGKEDMLYYVVANNTPEDVWHYPDSGKWGVSTLRRIFQMKEVPYFTGEE